ncbi:MAG TPA: hypothetical protein VF916_07800, partial [Ktedonobacterales bacterium]
PAGEVSIAATILDPSGWADVSAWLADEENVSRLLAYSEAKSKSGKHSLTSRLDAADAQIAVFRDKMSRLAETISDTADRESRQVLQAKLDDYSGLVREQEAKKARLVQEASEAANHAEQARTVREWVRVVAGKVDGASPAEQRTVLKALGAEVTIWHADYQHPDGWPQRYKIVLHFTGYTGQPVTLPAHFISNNQWIGHRRRSG